MGAGPQKQGPYTADQFQPGDPYERSDGWLVECVPTGGHGFGANQLGATVVSRAPSVSEAGVDTGSSPSPEGRKLGLDEGRKLGLDEGRKLGLDEGRVLAMRKMLRRVLWRRGLVPSAAEDARIEACTDLAVLDRWIEAAITASSVAEALR